MLRAMGRLSLVAWSVCAALVLGAVGVGWLFPSHQFIYVVHYEERAERGIMIADVEHRINLPINVMLPSGFALSSRGILALTGEGNSIITFDIVENHQRLLVPNDISYSTGVFDAAWSPDGEMLTFIVSDHSRYHLSQWIYLSDGTSVRNLMPDRSFRALREVTWSPSDGAYISFIGHENNNGNPTLYTLNVSSGEILALSPQNLNASHAVWSPDGMHLAFEGLANVYVVNVDGSDLHRVTNSSVGFPTWSPDGEHITYSSYSTGAIYALNLDNRERELLFQGVGGVGSAEWSPDGTLIAFTASTERGDVQVYVMRADGSDLRRVSYDGAVGIAPVWLP